VTRYCTAPDCDRAPVPTSVSGIVHAMCADHEREALSAFGENWADQARAGVLRPAITGGLPIEPTDHPDSPLGAGRKAAPGAPSRSQRGAGLVGSPS
jgi:hypothetical protein